MRQDRPPWATRSIPPCNKGPTGRPIRARPPAGPRPRARRARQGNDRLQTPALGIERQTRLTKPPVLAQDADLRDELRPVDQHLRPGVADQSSQLSRRESPVERLQDRAQLAAGKPDVEILDAVVGQNGHAIALAHAKASQKLS